MTSSRKHILCLFILLLTSAAAARSALPDSAEILLESRVYSSLKDAQDAGWTTWAQREEIRPAFSIGGPGSDEQPGHLVIDCGANPLARGGWMRVVEGIKPGAFYRLTASCRVRGVAFPALKTLARLVWLDWSGNRVLLPEYVSEETGRSGDWRSVAGRFRAPEKASAVRVELYLGNAPQGAAWWRDIVLTRVPAPEKRPVKIGSVYCRPSGKSSSEESIAEFCAVLEQAGQLGCDIVCLPEAINRIGLTGVEFPDIAEPIPGPTTKRLGEIARRHGMYIVAGITERDGAGVYSSAALLGRDGGVQGVYRRVYLSEIHADQGVSPGNAYPVFDTDFGRIGIMTGYDSWTPDPARELAAQGAEIIFLPVWGDNEVVIRARTLENHVFLALSAYDNVSRIFDPWGEEIAVAEQRPGLAVADIDLNYPPPCPFPWPQPDMRLRMLHERRLDIPPPLLAR